MARSTDTRQRVREIAAQLSAQGTEPTLTLVRGLLGKGSPNTIVEELRKWRERQAGSLPPTNSPAGTPPSPAQKSSPLPAPVGLDEVLRSLQSARELLERQTAGVQEVESLKQALSAVSAVMHQNMEQTAALMSALETDRKIVVDSLGAMQARYEGIQKHMLMSIEQAREEARTWKERAKEAQEEASTWRLTIQRRIETLLDEKGVLKGRLDAVTAELERVRLSRVPPPLPQALPVPGSRELRGARFEPGFDSVE